MSEPVSRGRPALATVVLAPIAFLLVLLGMHSSYQQVQHHLGDVVTVTPATAPPPRTTRRASAKVASSGPPAGSRATEHTQSAPAPPQRNAQRESYGVDFGGDDEKDDERRVYVHKLWKRTRTITGEKGDDASTELNSSRVYYAPTGSYTDAQLVAAITDTREFPMYVPVLDAVECSITSFDDGHTLPQRSYDHLWRLLGRTRKTATLRWAEGLVPSDDDYSALVRSVRGLLVKEAPMWYVVLSKSSRELRKIELSRKLHMFVFAITEGAMKSIKAVIEDRTWGQRTPIVWYSDVGHPLVRPYVDLHPTYLKNKFDYLSYKITRIWRRVFRDFGGQFDWYVRLWDDNYFLEENAYNVLARFDPKQPIAAGKIGWRVLADDVVFPFMGGGAGWFISRAGMERFGTTVGQCEKYMVEIRSKRHIFLPHAMHDEDVFLTACFDRLNVTFRNMPGVEHVSPGMGHKQRCMADKDLSALRWGNKTIFFDYPGRDQRFRVEEAWYAFHKPIVWHYMTPRRNLHMEKVLYPWRAAQLDADFPTVPATYADKPGKKSCYPGLPREKKLPPRGVSMFEKVIADPE